MRLGWRKKDSKEKKNGPKKHKKNPDLSPRTESQKKFVVDNFNFFFTEILADIFPRGTEFNGQVIFFNLRNIFLLDEKTLREFGVYRRFPGTALGRIGDFLRAPTIGNDDVGVDIDVGFWTFGQIFGWAGIRKGRREKVRNISEKICPNFDRRRNFFVDTVFVCRWRRVGHREDAAVEVRAVLRHRHVDDVTTDDVAQETNFIKKWRSVARSRRYLHCCYL